MIMTENNPKDIHYIIFGVCFCEARQLHDAVFDTIDQEPLLTFGAS